MNNIIPLKLLLILLTNSLGKKQAVAYFHFITLFILMLQSRIGLEYVFCWKAEKSKVSGEKQKNHWA